MGGELDECRGLTELQALELARFPPLLKGLEEGDGPARVAHALAGEAAFLAPVVVVAGGHFESMLVMGARVPRPRPNSLSQASSAFGVTSISLRPSSIPGDRTFKLGSGTASEYGLYVKSLGRGP
jgi:hypothetical protein